jgi:hypothetical protein
MNALNTDARKVVITVKFIAFILPGVVLHLSHRHNISQRYLFYRFSGQTGFKVNRG